MFYHLSEGILEHTLEFKFDVQYVINFLSNLSVCMMELA